MKNNNINWVGNKVIDSGSSHQASRPQPPEWSFSDAPPLATQRNELPNTGRTISPPPLPPPKEMPDSGRLFQPGPPPTSDIQYIPGYLASNIGKNVRAEFIVGSYQYTDKTGKLVAVGVNYFVLEDVNSGTLIMCDLYSVKFVTIII